MNINLKCKYFSYFKYYRLNLDWINKYDVLSGMLIS